MNQSLTFQKNILNFNFKTNKHGLISDLCVRLQYISDSLCNSDSASASAYELSYAIRVSASSIKLDDNRTLYAIVNNYSTPHRATLSLQ